MVDVAKLDEFINKVDKMKKENKLDLSSDQDLSIAIMNLVSLEEHFIFSGAKTNKPSYYDLVKDVREMRKELMLKLVRDVEEGSELWCIAKHLLAAAMRLMEVGTKQLGMGKKHEAYDFFQKAYNLYVLFWGLNMKAIDVEGVEALADDQGEQHNSPATEQSNLFGKLGKMVKKAIDCCLE
jgi:hypothetical protein